MHVKKGVSHWPSVSLMIYNKVPAEGKLNGGMPTLGGESGNEHINLNTQLTEGGDEDKNNALAHFQLVHHWYIVVGCRLLCCVGGWCSTA
jgi:hypothetical protein